MVIEVSEEQVLHFRARRGHIIGPGAPDAMSAAQAIVGAQAQAVGTGVLALSQRTKGRPTAAAIRALFKGPKRRLVRTWGQRGTMHMYDARDWRDIIAAFESWSPNQRRGPMPSDALVERALAEVAKNGSATRRDLLNVASKAYLTELESAHAKYLKTREETRKFAAGRLLYALCLRGDTCVGDKIGSQQTYAARSVWFPKLPWPDRESGEAAIALTRRYLSVSGPATAKDVAHHFGARQREAKAWLAALEDEIEEVACGDRRGLVALREDISSLRKKPPKKWPLRLMPQWDTYLMGHADKSWTVPDEADRKVVWRGSAVVAAAVLNRGRVVAEWNHDVVGKRLMVTVKPLSGWSKSLLREVKSEAAVVAAHYGVDEASVRDDT